VKKQALDDEQFLLFSDDGFTARDLLVGAPRKISRERGKEEAKGKISWKRGLSRLSKVDARTGKSRFVHDGGHTFFPNITNVPIRRMCKLNQSSSHMVTEKNHMEYQESSTHSNILDDDDVEQSTSYCETREDEQQQQHPQHGQRYESRIDEKDDDDDEEDEDKYSIEAACTDLSMGSGGGDGFGRDDSSSYIQVLADAMEDSTTKRSFLCRCLAWSQDSLDERVAKKYRQGENTTTSPPSSPTSPSNESIRTFSYDPLVQQQHRRQGGTESLHWEEKVVDSLDLIHFIRPNSSTIARA